MSRKKSLFLAFFCPLGCDLAFDFRQFARKRLFFCLKKGVFAGFRGCWYIRAIISGALWAIQERCFPIVSKLFRSFLTLNPCQSWCTSVLFPTWTEVSFCPSSLNRRTIEKSTRARTTILQAPCPVYLADLPLGAKQGVPHWSGHLARLTGDLWTFGSARH